MSLFKKIVFPLIILMVIIAACSGNKTFTVNNVENNQAVKFYLNDGSTDSGIILGKENGTLTYVSNSDHERKTINSKDIRRVEKLDIIYDYRADEISKAEIDKTKSSRNTWGYAIGGAFIGAAGGLAVGLPLWYADVDQVPPYFYAGAGAVAGSIFFAVRGQEKDRQDAIREIRIQRLMDQNLQKELDTEKQKLNEIEKERKKLQEELKKKEKDKK